MSNSTGLKSGQKAGRSGQYQQVCLRGGRGKEVTVIRGDPLPPTPRHRTSYTLVDSTNDKSGRGR